MTGFIEWSTNQWLDYYWPKWSANEWELLVGEDRREGQNSLVKHMVNASRPAEQLDTLVSEAWLMTWQYFDRAYTGFLRDAELIARSLNEGHAPQSLAVGLRFALCRASAGTPGQQIPPALIAPAIRLGFMAPENLLDFFESSQVAGVNLVAIFWALREVLPGAGILQALEWAERLPVEAGPGHSARLEACAGVLIGAKGAARQRVMDLALAGIQKIEQVSNRAHGIRVLAPYLEADEAAVIAPLAYELLPQPDRGLTLSTLIGKLSGAEQARAQAEALAVAFDTRVVEEIRAEVVGSLAPVIGASAGGDLVEAAKGISKPRQILKLLFALAPHVPATGRSQLLGLALLIADAEYRAVGLSALLPWVDPQAGMTILNEMTRCIAAAELPSSKVVVLAYLLPWLIPETRLPMLDQALETMNQLPLGGLEDHSAPGRFRPRALGGEPPETVEMAREAERSGTYIASPYVEALRRLLPALSTSPEHLQKALSMAQAVGFPRRRAQALALLFPQLAGEQRQQVGQLLLQDIRGLPVHHPKGSPRAMALAELAPTLAGAPDLLEGAIEAARSIQPRAERSSALTAIAGAAPPEQARLIYYEALACAREPGGEEALPGLLLALAPFLKGSERAEALETARCYLPAVDHPGEKENLTNRLAQLAAGKGRVKKPPRPPDGASKSAEAIVQALAEALSRGIEYEMLGSLYGLLPELTALAGENPRLAGWAFNQALLDSPAWPRARLVRALTTLAPFLAALCGSRHKAQAAYTVMKEVLAVYEWKW